MSHTSCLRHFRILLVLVLCALPLSGLEAQDCAGVFPPDGELVLHYVNFDGDEVTTGGYEVTFLGKEEHDNQVIGHYVYKLLDDRGKEYFERKIDVTCKGGAVHFTADQLLNGATLSAYEKMQVEISGEPYHIPLQGEAGLPLDDCSVQAVVYSGDVQISKLSVEVSSRTIAGREVIQTPLGALDCLKYTYDSFSEVGSVKQTTSHVRWFHPVYGWVRSETYNKKGKLIACSRLMSVSP